MQQQYFSCYDQGEMKSQLNQGHLVYEAIVSSSEPLEHCKRKGGSGEYSTFCVPLWNRNISVVQSDWLVWQLSHLYLVVIWYIKA